MHTSAKKLVPLAIVALLPLLAGCGDAATSAVNKPERPVQVQHISTDAMDTKERRKIAERLKRNDRTQLCMEGFLIRKKLRQASYSQTAGQHIHGQASAEAGFDGREQAQDREGITAKIKKIRTDTNW